MPSNTIETDLKNYSFLVTGGAGFIGSNLAIHLVNAGVKKLRVLDDLSTGNINNLSSISNHPSFEFIEGDIRDAATCENACAGIDFVLHQAALGSVPRSIDNPIATNSVNVDGFLNMINAARKNNVKRFVYASSSSVYGDDPTMPKTEEKTGNLLSPYAVSKHTNEQYAKVFSRVYGMETIGLRYFNVFGPMQNPAGPYAAVIPLFIQAMMKGNQPVIFGDGENTRDFTYIDNVVHANVLAALTPGIGNQSPVLNIAFGGTISLNQIYKMLAKVIDFQLPPKYAAERKGDIKNSFADIKRAKELLGYAPVKELQDGLRLTVDWYRQNPGE